MPKWTILEISFLWKHYTAIPYRVITGWKQGFPCEVFPHREKPVLITWNPCSENRLFPVRKTSQGKPCFHYRDGFAVCTSSHVCMYYVWVLSGSCWLTNFEGGFCGFLMDSTLLRAGGSAKSNLEPNCPFVTGWCTAGDFPIDWQNIYL